MDVISLSKASKAKKAMQALNSRLGEGVQDIHANVKTRLEELEKKDPHVTLYNRVSEVETNNAINLNKHNLHINTIVNKNRYGLSDLAFDDFGDDTGIDKVKSVNQTFDATGKRVKQTDTTKPSEVITTTEDAGVVPQMVNVSFAFNEQLTAGKNADLVNGVFLNTETVSGKLQLKKKDATNFFSTGSYESPILDLGTNYKALKRLDQIATVPTGTLLTVSTATSADGVTFTAYLPLNTDGTIASPTGRYIKVKVDLVGSGAVTPRTIMDFVATEVSNFPANDKVFFDGSLHMKTTFNLPMNTDVSFTDTGTLLRKSIDKSSFKAIEKVSVN